MIAEQRLVIWGTGVVAERIMNDIAIPSYLEIVGIIDNDTTKQGSYFHSYEIMPPNYINKLSPDAIVILTDAYEAITNQIKNEFPEYVGKVHNKNYFYKDRLLKRYEKTNDSEIRDITNTIMQNDLQVFNYSFIEKYKDMEIQVDLDESAGLYYVMHSGKKMYFSNCFDSEKKVIDYYKSILVEQDERSPHRYFDKNFKVNDGDIVIDVGAAEGNFSLSIIDYVKKIYIIESDEAWIEALKHTFKDYLDKVVLINTFISADNYGCNNTLDTLINEKINFIKMDIEGYEWEALIGAEKIIKESEVLSMAICCYHNDSDQAMIEKILDQYKIGHTTTEGYMWFPGITRSNYVSTRLNRAIIQAKK